jgi:YD repeat-containing protein
LTVTNPLAEVLQYTYENNFANNGAGKVLTITGDVPGGDLRFAYDTFDRVQTVTYSEGLALRFDYDNLDRTRRITYPDGSYEQFEYQNQSLVAERDRAGRWTRHNENSLRQRVRTREPDGRVTQYEWCLCGSLRKLIDGNGRVTEWTRDLQGRITEQRLPDGNRLTFTYDYSGRLGTVVNGRGQTITLGYATDDALLRTDYSSADTPDIVYAYDPTFTRLTSRTDGAGTTNFFYHPIANGTLGAGQLSFTDGPLPNDTVKDEYDALGRLRRRSIVDDATRLIATYSQTFAFDRRGRAQTLTDSLGAFTYAYVGQSNRASSVTFPNGMRQEFQYFPAAQDELVSRIRNLAAGTSAVISQFDYTYQADRRGKRAPGTSDTTSWGSWSMRSCKGPGKRPSVKSSTATMPAATASTSPTIRDSGITPSIRATASWQNVASAQRRLRAR